MTMDEVRAELARKVPGRSNVLPMIRKGSRVEVSFRGITASGTIRTSYGTADDAVADVVLDGSGEVVSVTWARLSPIKGGR